MPAPRQENERRKLQIIEGTPLILEAIIKEQIHNLKYKLIGMFNLRSSLISCLDTDPNAAVELQMLEELLGRILIYLAEWSGPGKIAGELLLMGAIDSRGDVMRLIAPIYDYMDGKEVENPKIPMIGIVGKISSGKGTAGEYIEKLCHGRHLPLSDRLRELAESEGAESPYPREKLREINDKIKPRFGNSTFVNWTIDAAKRLAPIYDYKVISMDGFRSLEEAQFFKNSGGILIAITASADTRFNRLVERNRGADDFSREAFNKSDAIEGAWIDPIIEIADIVIQNETSEQELQNAVLEFVTSAGFVPNQ